MEFISGKEALIALANGEVVEVQYLGNIQWYEVSMAEPLSTFKESGNNFRLKTRTIPLNGIEVPAPFEPKHGDDIWFLNPDYGCGYADGDYDPAEAVSQFGVWRTEEEIKQVVDALRKVFKEPQQ